MLIDTHVHLQDKKFARDLDRVIDRARDAGIERMAVIADDLGTSLQSIEMARRHPGLLATVGIHPQHEPRVKLGEWEGIEAEIRGLGREPGVVAIGEIGLDHHYPGFRAEPQAELMLRQARIATDLGLPMVIHCRDAYPDLIRLFNAETSVKSRGVVHCFSGSLSDARELIDLGFHLGVGGSITYPKAEELRETIRTVGLDRVVCETDAPYLPPQAKRGRRNEPSYMKYAVAELAKLFALAYQDVARITTANAMRLYSLTAPAGGETARLPEKRCYLDIADGSARAAEILAAIREPSRFEEFVIWGHEEPTLRLDAVLELAREMKGRGWRVGLETNGHGSLIHGRNIAPELAGLVDAVAITMNGREPGAGFNAMIEFAREARKRIPDVRMQVAPLPGVDIEACRRLAEDDLRVGLQIRPGRPGGHDAPAPP